MCIEGWWLQLNYLEYGKHLLNMYGLFFYY